jgi:hypothetical protein
MSGQVSSSFLLLSSFSLLSSGSGYIGKKISRGGDQVCVLISPSLNKAGVAIFVCNHDNKSLELL